ncbi:MAG: hypothetical protein LQ350_000535 [Teloschistes chrysophthalmus]|nr:MAG: hypothetical protein LQ350_000535 [Niorma chrysophthalma]
MEGENMKALWERTNDIISSVNDILSLKKEIAHNAFYSLVPLLFVRSSTDGAQNAVDQATDFLVEKIRDFETVARQLVDHHEEEEEEEATVVKKRRQVGDFIRGRRYLCTGNLTWR